MLCQRKMLLAIKERMGSVPEFGKTRGELGGHPPHSPACGTVSPRIWAHQRVELIESAEQMCYTSYAKYGTQREGG